VRRMYTLKAMDIGFATGHAAPAVILSGNFESSRRGLQTWSESREGFERCDHLRMRRLLKCRLAWYGFRSVEVSSFGALTKDINFKAPVPFSAALRSTVSRASSTLRPVGR
jgi:hypothetical protein